jgi:Tfp pilus assembly protein PilO
MKLNTRDRALLGVVVILVLCGAYYKLLLTPEQHKASHLQTQITSAQAALASAQQQDLAGRAAEVALRESQPNWDAAQHAIPQVADVPFLLKLLTHTSQSAHVTMQSIALSAAEPGVSTASTSTTGTSTTGTATTGTATTGTSTTGASTTAAGSTAGTAALASGALTVTTIPVALTFTGGYQALNRLVKQLDSLVTVSRSHLHTTGPLVGISNVSVAPTANTADPSQLSIKLTASIYQRSDNTEGAG